MERVLELLRVQGVAGLTMYRTPYHRRRGIAFDHGLPCLQRLRAMGVKVQMASAGEGMGSFKSQFKRADASGAQFALIFGATKSPMAWLLSKALRDGVGQQEQHALNTLEQWANRLQSPLNLIYPWQTISTSKNKSSSLMNSKHFWKQYGNLISWILIVVLGAIRAWNGYQYWQTRQAAQAAVMYDEVDKVVRGGDVEKAQRAFNDMKDRFAWRCYTPNGLLCCWHAWPTMRAKLT